MLVKKPGGGYLHIKGRGNLVVIIESQVPYLLKNTLRGTSLLPGSPFRIMTF